MSKYDYKCFTEGIKFCPLVVETTGAWYNEALKVLKRLGQALARALWGDEGGVVRHMFGRLLIILQGDNKTLLLNHIPTITQSEVNSYI